MVHGTRTTQNAIENIAAEMSLLFGVRGLVTALAKAPSGRRTPNSIVIPIAAANKPLSGRNKTAIPHTIPVNPHNHRVAFELLNANVVVKHARTAKKLVGTSVRIVAT